MLPEILKSAIGLLLAFNTQKPTDMCTNLLFRTCVLLLWFLLQTNNRRSLMYPLLLLRRSVQKTERPLVIRQFLFCPHRRVTSFGVLYIPPGSRNAKNNIVHPSSRTKREAYENFRPAFSTCGHHKVRPSRNVLSEMRSYHGQTFRSCDRQRNRFVISVLNVSPLVSNLLRECRSVNWQHFLSII